MGLFTGRGSQSEIEKIGISPVSGISSSQSKRLSDWGFAGGREELFHVGTRQNSLMVFTNRQILLVVNNEFDTSIFAYDYKCRRIRLPRMIIERDLIGLFRLGLCRLLL